MGKNRVTSPIQTLNRKKLIAFGWYGGKYNHLDWLLPQLPESYHFVDVFGGSAAVILNRDPSPIDTYNDINGEVVNFFKTLREKKNELIEQITLTPYSRQEYATACEIGPKLDQVEMARRFFIRAIMTRSGLATKSSLGRWANCITNSRTGMADVVSRWVGKPDRLVEVVDRFRKIQIENRPAIDLIQKYDTPNTLFYCDPPYIHESRKDRNTYAYEMSDADHERLASVLNSIYGMLAISGYDSDMMNDLYPESKWRKIEGPLKISHASKTQRQEYLWVNYPKERLLKQSNQISLL